MVTNYTGAIYDGKSDQLQLVQKDALKPGIGEILLKVAACGICGTDVKILKGESHASPPVITGHEFCGIVEEVGPRVKNVQVGEFVAVDPNIYCGQCSFCREGKINLCRNLQALGVDIDGGFAEFCVVPAKQCYPLPGDLPVETAILTEPLSCAVYGNQLAEIHPGDQVGIIGGGIIGQMMIQLAQISGASSIVATDPDAERRRQLEVLGVDLVVDPMENDAEEKIQDYTHGGAERVIECVGSIPTVEQSIKLVRDGGVVVLFGVSPMDSFAEISPYELYKRDLSIRGSFLNPFTFQTAARLISSHSIDFSSLEIKRFPLNNINQAIEHQLSRSSLKTIIDLSIEE